MRDRDAFLAGLDAANEEDARAAAAALQFLAQAQGLERVAAVIAHHIDRVVEGLQGQRGLRKMVRTFFNKNRIPNPSDYERQIPSLILNIGSLFGVTYAHADPLFGEAAEE